jgi:membrane protease YdiL (CAAX protease family)
MSTWIRDHRLAAFFGITLFVTWLPWPFWAFDMLPFVHLPIGPLFAALVVIGIAEGAAGYRDLGSRLIRWRVGWQWWVIAAGTPLVVLAVAAVANVTIFGAPAPVLASVAWGAVALNFAIRWIDPLDGPVGEEPGFRGYALPLLQVHRTPLGAATLLGAFAALWHIPLVFSGQLALFSIAATFAITFVYVWLFNHTGGSLLMTLLFHILQGTVKIGMLGFAGADAVRMDVLTGVLWIVLAIVLVVIDRNAWRAAPAPAVAASPDRRLTV